MKKHRRKTSKPGNPAPNPKRKKMSRRDMLGLAKFAAIGAAVLGGGGYYFVGKVLADIEESDLSKLGNGIPAIVQVHDPGCPSCRALQSETREALKTFEDGEIQYLVANLQSPEGRRFADLHGAGRVTLLFFDGAGRFRDRIQGERPKDMLVSAFRRHLRRAG